MKRTHRRSTYSAKVEQYTACDECDWLIALPQLSAGQRAVCPRCGHTLKTMNSEPRYLPLALSLAALIMLICSNLFTFLGMSVKGIHQNMTLYQTASTLFEEQHEVLAFAVYLFMQIFPTICLLLICFIYTKLGHWRGKRWRKYCTVWLFRLIPWCMVEVFLIGVLVSLIKISSLADITLGYSFWAYILFVICIIKAFGIIDRDWLWQQLSGPIHLRQQPEPTGQAIQQGLTLCHSCHGLTPLRAKRCPRCHSHVHSRKSASLQRTMALLFTAVVLYIPANVLPIMVTESIGKTTYSTILGGVVLLWDMGSYPVAMVIFIASILVPIVKMLSLCWLCWSVYTGKTEHKRSRTRLYRLTEFIGRWSMIDVFVVAILVALIRMGQLMSIYPGTAALSFAGVVILTMLSAMSFDPRLMWDIESPSTNADDDTAEDD